jgi:hypothetical protein
MYRQDYKNMTEEKLEKLIDQAEFVRDAQRKPKYFNGIKNLQGMPCLIIVIHSRSIDQQGFSLSKGFRSQNILTLQSFFDFAKLSVPFFSIPCYIGAAMNISYSFAPQQSVLSSRQMPAGKSFHFLPFSHQFGMSSVSYSSLFFPQCDVRHAEFCFLGSLLKEGSSWRMDLIRAPS